MKVDLSIKGDVSVLRLQPGDRIVVSLDRRIAPSQASPIRDALQEEFPDHRVILLTGGVQLFVERDEAAA